MIKTDNNALILKIMGDIWCKQKTGNIVPDQISFLLFCFSTPPRQGSSVSSGCLEICSVDQVDLLFCFKTLFQFSVD